MSHPVVSREEWTLARRELLVAEKELTRQSDELARKRQALPWVRIDKSYEFDTSDGKKSLEELFASRSQLLLYHFMFGPDYSAGCPSCSSIADQFDGIAPHLANHDVMFWAISRAPMEKLATFQCRMGWTFPWASSFESDFNFDFGVSYTEEQQRSGGIVYNYSREPGTDEGPKGPEIQSQNTPDGAIKGAATAGTDVATYARERPGMSSLIMENGQVYHTYSAFSRGLDALWGIYQWLDRAPKGRNETGHWIRLHDSYGALPQASTSCCQGA
jgi:predicted dithiol-disulfide oxidoreductase (DUF899 family)